MKYWWGAAGVLVAIVVAWLLLRGGGDAPATSAAPVAAHGSAPTVRVAIAGRRIAGIVERDGAPVPGAAVQLASAAGEEHVVADATGRFDFGPQPPRAYVVSAQATGATGDARAIDLRREAADDLHLVMHACDASIFGVVRDVSGGTIPGARVAHSLDGVHADLAATTGADGAYELCVPRGETSLLVSAEGYATELGEVFVSSNTRHDIALSPEAAIHGRVMHAGAPVAGAQVRLRGSMMAAYQRPADAIADGDGRFMITGARPGNYQLTADAPHLATPHAIAVAARVGASDDIVVELAAAFDLDGRVVEEGSRAGVAYQSVTLSNGQDAFRDAFTGADGGFALAGVPAGEYVMTVYQEVQVQQPIVVAADVHGATITVATRVAIGGRVLRDGQPVEGARVTSHGERSTSDRDGRYALRLPKGAQQIHATSERVGAFTLKQVEVDRPRGDVDLELDLAGSIAGRVVDQAGAPVANALVECLRLETNDYGAGATGDDGAFVARALSGGGNYQCSASRGDHGMRYPLVDGKNAAEVALADGRSAVTGVMIAVRIEHLRIAGRVVDASGAPVPDIEVMAAGPGTATTATTDASGAFELRDLAKATYSLVAKGPHGGERVDDIAAGRTDVVIALPANGRLVGTLTGFPNPPHVLLFRQSIMDEDAVTMTATGFRVDAIAAGDYDVIAFSREARVEGDVTVVAGKTATIALTATPTGTIKGTVRDAAQHPATFIPCVARANGHAIDGGSDGSGVLRISYAIPGPNVVTCGRDPSPHPVDVVAGQTANLDIEVAERPAGPVHLGLALADRDGQVFVSAVEPDGIAARAGIAVGDRLVRWQRFKARPPSAQLVEILEHFAEEQPIDVALERAGKPFTVTLGN